MIKRILSIIYIIVLSELLLLNPVYATNYTSTSFKIKDPVQDNGANFNSSSSYQQSQSIGQDVQGKMTSTNYIIKTGFQYYDYGFASSSITFTLSGLNINFVSLISGGNPITITNGTTLTVLTNAIYGYNLLVQENNDLTNQYSETIPALLTGSTTTAINWPANTAPSSGTYGFGYNASGTDSGSFNGSCVSDCYKQFSSSNQISIASTSSITAGTGDSTNITYQISIPSTQYSGTYTNNILFSAVPSY